MSMVSEEEDRTQDIARQAL